MLRVRVTAGVCLCGLDPVSVVVRHGFGQREHRKWWSRPGEGARGQRDQRGDAAQDGETGKGDGARPEISVYPSVAVASNRRRPGGRKLLKVQVTPGKASFFKRSAVEDYSLRSLFVMTWRKAWSLIVISRVPQVADNTSNVFTPLAYTQQIFIRK